MEQHPSTPPAPEMTPAAFHRMSDEEKRAFMLSRGEMMVPPGQLVRARLEQACRELNGKDHA